MHAGFASHLYGYPAAVGRGVQISNVTHPGIEWNAFGGCRCTLLCQTSWFVRRYALNTWLQATDEEQHIAFQGLRLPGGDC